MVVLLFEILVIQLAVQDGPPCVETLEEDGEEAEARNDDRSEPNVPPPKESSQGKHKSKSKPRQVDPEFTVARGIDFKRVACVLNFDLPTTSKSYTHRVGRTAARPATSDGPQSGG